MPLDTLNAVPILLELALLAFLLILTVQKRSPARAMSQRTLDAASPIGKKHGDTDFRTERRVIENRLNELDRKNALINKFPVNHRQGIVEFQGGDDSYHNELEKLNAELRELCKEYNVNVSQSYLLRKSQFR